MSRSANEANAAVFNRLISYAADHGVAIPAASRRIFLSEDEFEDLATSKRIEHLRIGRAQAASLLNTRQGTLLAVAGFEAEFTQTSRFIRELELSGGLVVAALRDLEIEPTASPDLVLNIVGAGSVHDAGYSGHDWDDIRGLFPSLKFYEIHRDIDSTNVFSACLLSVCAVEGAYGNGWINDSLALELARLGEQRIPGFPYESLVRASLDLDPTNLFLALYRCLEATYAFTRASELATKLGIKDRSWLEVATALGDSLNWYPRHDQSLSAVLALPAVDRMDLQAIALAFEKEATGEEVAGRVATSIRELRNSLVHYGPTNRPAHVPDNDWNRLCTPLARIVGCVFAHTYGGLAANPSIVTRVRAPTLEPARQDTPEESASVTHGQNLFQNFLRLLCNRK